MKKEKQLNPDEFERRKIIAANIEALLEKNNVKKNVLAKHIGLVPSTITDYVKLRATPSHGVIQKIADYFDIPKTEIDTTFKTDDSQSPISLSESILLKHFNTLNDKGKEKTIEYAKDLSRNPMYQQNDEPLLNAAHARPNATPEDIQHDDDIMDDENF